MAENQDPTLRDLTATVGEQLREKDEREREAAQAARRAEADHERIERHKAEERAEAAKHAEAAPAPHAFASGAATPRRWGVPREGAGGYLGWRATTGAALVIFALAPKGLRRLMLAAVAAPFLAREVWPRLRGRLEEARQAG
jgi:hypothetical protein